MATISTLATNGASTLHKTQNFIHKPYCKYLPVNSKQSFFSYTQENTFVTVTRILELVTPLHRPAWIDIYPSGPPSGKVCPLDHRHR